MPCAAMGEVSPSTASTLRSPRPRPRLGSGGDGSRLPLTPAHRRARGGARCRGDRIQLDRAARAARRRVRGGGRCASRGSSTRSRCPAARPRCTSRSSSSGSAPATRSRAPTSRSPRPRTRSRTSARRPFFVDADEATWTMDPALLDQAIDERRAAGGAGAGGDRGRSLRPVLRLRRAPRGVRAPRRRAHPGLDGVARRDVPRRARGRPGGARRLLLQRQQDHHDERRRDARLREPRLDRARAQALDAGARAGCPLRAPRDRLQLPVEQSSRRAGARRSSRRCRCAWPHAGGSATGTASSSTAFPASRSCPRRRTGRRTPGSPASSSTRRRSEPTARRSDSLSRPRTSRRGRSGSRCTCSRSSRRTASFGGDVGARFFERGLCLPSGSSLTEDDQDRVVATMLAARPR